MKIDSALNLS